MPGITTMGRAAVLLFSPSSSHLCCSLPATNGPVSCTCKAEECDASLHTTRGWRTGCACSQVITCHVCEHATQLLHLHLASSCHSSSSRDQQTSLPFRRRHPHNAAPLPLVCAGESLAHCHPSQPPSHEALALTRFRGRTLSSMKCVWHIGCMGPPHTALCCTAVCCDPCATTTTTTSSSRCR